MNLFSAVTAEDMQMARIVTGATMVAFLAVSLAPGWRAHAGRIRLALLVIYLVSCVLFVGYVILR